MESQGLKVTIPEAASLRLDERNHVEKPMLDQLDGLGWEIIDLDSKQHPGDSHRANFTEVVMLPVLRAQLKVIQPWLEDDQVEDDIKLDIRGDAEALENLPDHLPVLAGGDGQRHKHFGMAEFLDDRSKLHRLRAGAPALLINNAAVMARPAPIWELSAEEVAPVITVNIPGTIHVIRHFLPAMIR